MRVFLLTIFVASFLQLFTLSFNCGNVEQYLNTSLWQPTILHGGQVQILDHWKFWRTDVHGNSTKGTFDWSLQLPGFNIGHNSDILYLEGNTIFIILHENYFHFIHETLCMLECLRLNGIFSTYKKLTILSDTKPWFTDELLRLFQLDIVGFRTALPGVGYRVPKKSTFIIPPHNYHFVTRVTTYIDHQYILLKSLKSRLKLIIDNPSEILYVSRKNDKRNIPQEAELIAKLKSLFPSLAVVDSIDLWVYEQQNLFANAKIVIAPHGAALANMIYSNWEKVILIEIAGISKAVSFHRWLMVEHHYVIWTKQVHEGEFADPNFKYYGDAPLDVESHSMAKLINRIIKAPHTLIIANNTWGSCKIPKMNICYRKTRGNYEKSNLAVVSCHVNEECNHHCFSIQNNNSSI